MVGGVSDEPEIVCGELPQTKIKSEALMAAATNVDLPKLPPFRGNGEI